MFEITLRTKVALEAINVMSKNKNFIVGVGTLMTDSNIQNAIDVGAKFGVSLFITLLQLCKIHAIFFLPL